MKLTAFYAFTTLAAMFPSTLSSPLTIEVREAEIPTDCIPDGPEQMDSYQWDDESPGRPPFAVFPHHLVSKTNVPFLPVCQAQGVGETCCVVAQFGISKCGITSKQDLADIESAVSQQIQQSHQFHSTPVGRWTATYTAFRDDEANPAVLSEWYRGLGNIIIALDGKNFSQIDFTLIAEDASAVTRVGVVCVE